MEFRLDSVPYSPSDSEMTHVPSSQPSELSFENQRLTSDSALNLTARKNLKTGRGVIMHVAQFRALQLASDVGWLKSINIPLLLSHCHP